MSRIIFAIRKGLRRRDGPPSYRPRKTIYNRFIRWNRLSVFHRIFAKLAAKDGKADRLMNVTPHLKAHRTTSSPQKEGYAVI